MITICASPNFCGWWTARCQKNLSTALPWNCADTAGRLTAPQLRVQLLGQSQPWLAENTWRAAELGSWGVDLNCSCLSKTVNGSGGGAPLLKDPELLYQTAKAIRAAVPADLPVSVKVRLGWDSSSRSLEIPDAVEQAGASEIAVHGRTKADGYRAGSIDWPAIAAIRQRLRIPVIANGEVMDWRS